MVQGLNVKNFEKQKVLPFEIVINSVVWEGKIKINKYFQKYAPETNCLQTAQQPNAVTSSFSPLRPCVLNSD